jgi:long-chain acyl-CoA synthetase
VRHHADRTLQDLCLRLPSFGQRQAVGLRQEFGLRWWSFAELHRRSLTAARLLAAVGVSRGDRVVLWGPSSPEWVGFFFGVLLRGAVVVPVDDGAPPDLARRLAEQAGARHLVAARDRQLPGLCARLDFESLYGGGPAGDGAEVVAAEPEDAAVVFFTSGTTSTPRGVVLTHANVISQLARFAAWRPLVRVLPFRIMVSAPLSHAQGVMLGISIPLCLGLSVIYTRFNHPGHLIRSLRDNRVTLFSTVPRVLQVLEKALESRPYGRRRETLATVLARTRSRFLRRHRTFTALRSVLGYRFWVILVGGAPLRRELELFWRDSGCLVVQGYGLTETAAVVSVNPPLFGAFGSIGKPLAHEEVRIADDGEILVRGPNVMPGYLGSPAGADRSGGSGPFTPDGYLRTGDLGRFDKRRRLFFEGRKNELIVTGEGWNVYAEDVETVLDAQPGVRQSVVIGLDRGGDSEVHAVVLLEPAGSASEAVRRANAELAPHQRVRGWTVWPEADFPRGSLLKVRRREVGDRLESLLAAGGTPAVAAGGDALALEAIAATEDRDQRLSLLARYLDEGSPAAGEERLRLAEDIGLGSLDVVELLSRLEQRSQLFLDHAVVDEAATVADLRAMLAHPNGQPPPRPLYARNPPRWSELRLLDLLRSALNDLVLLPWMAVRARLGVQGREHLRGLRPPVILAGIGHRHGSDVISIFAALPRGLRHRLAIVASRWVFGHFLEPGPTVPWSTRATVAVAFNVAIPLFFPFALTPHFGTTREGLAEACRLLDRGYSLIIFEGRGTALIAKQSGVPIVPVRLSGNEGVGFRASRPRRTVRVAFEAPLAATPDVDEAALRERLERLFQ